MTKLNSLTLKFRNKNEDVESKFLSYYIQKKLLQQRTAYILGAILYLTFGFLDSVMIPEMKTLFIGIRIFISFPIAIGTFLLTFTKFYKKYNQLILFISYFGACLLINLMIILASAPVNYLYYVGIILIIIFTFSFSGLRFIWSLVFGILLIIIYETTIVYLNMPVSIIINNTYFFITATIISLLASYSIESSIRKDFILTSHLKRDKEKVSKDKNNLELIVQRRTNELININEQLELELGKNTKLYEQQKLLQNQLVQLQKIEEIGHLTGGIAHDFNNLLTVINGYSEQLLKNKQSDNYEIILRIAEAGKDAADLTKQLLSFGKKQILTAETIEVNELVKKFEKMIKPLLIKNINIYFDYSDQDLKIKVDSGKLEQVILNLVVNARDAMPSGGKLIIKTSVIDIVDDNISKFSGVTKGLHAVISVIDSGIGMDTKILEHIFEPFFTTKEFGKGTGLGLSTVKAIVAQSGGSMYVSSKKDIGSRFNIVFPIILPRTNDISPLPKNVKTFSGKKTILLIEDHLNVLQFTKIILQKNNYNVFTATNENEALSLFQIYFAEIDIVISDIILPGKSGKKIVEHLLTLNKNIKYIFLSGYTNDVIDGDGVLSDDSLFIQKPFTEQALISKIEMVLNKKASK